MILSGTTTTVNFFVADSDGLPATGKASSISAALSINGGQATAISDTITEIDSTNLPGWYRFNHQFSTAGNVFINFSCTGCNIAPWEENVIDIPTAAAVATAVNVAGALTTYGAAKTSDIPTAATIGAAVDVSSALTTYGAAKASDIPTAAAIGEAVWTTEDRALSGFGVSAISNAVWTSVQIDFATSTQLYALENSITMKFNNLRADIPTAAENAAAALKLDVAAAQGEAAALSLATLILSQFNSSIDTDGRWTVYKTDGTVQTQRQVSTSDNAEPVTGIGAVDA